MFARIRNIEDVLPHFEGRDEFTIGKRDGFTVIDYNYVLPDTFDDPVRLEGRGIKFCNKTGAVLARPFHKFFNLNERNGSRFEDLDWDSPFVVQEKFDGSMIHPCILDDKLVLMTRKGISDVAIQAMKECDVPEDYMRSMLETGVTPIFEYVSPNNRIVLEYERPELKLLAVRTNETGYYLLGVGEAGRENIFMPGETDPKKLVDMVRSREGKEGVVLYWFNGHRVKLKADEYVKFHRAIDTMSSEKRILDVILDNADDDLCSMVSEDRATKIRDYATAVRKRMQTVTGIVKSIVDAKTELSQKDFALMITAPDYYWKKFTPELFGYRSGKLAEEEIGLKFIRRHSSTQTELETYRDVLDIPKLGNLAFNNAEN